MIRFVLPKLALAVPTLLIISLLVFVLQTLIPGDPVTAFSTEDFSAEAVAAIRARYGLDQPLPVRYFNWIVAVLQGDFGISIRTRLPIGAMLLQRLPVTFELASLAIIIALVIALPTGIISALKRGTAWDYVANIVALAGISVPNFWLGIMLILLFAVNLGWLPSGGYVGLWEDPMQNLSTLIMPALVLAAPTAAILMRHTRSAMLETLEQDYVRTARAKGLRERSVVLKHALRNALVPVITLGTLQFAELFAGAVLTEQVFGIPGFGKMLVDGVFSRDYGIVQAVVLVTGLGFVLVTILSNVLYLVANPRLRR